MSKRKNTVVAFAAAAAALTAAAADTADNLRYYSSVARHSSIDSGEGITREGVNKCVRKRRHKRRVNKRK